jgi:hypothetical protein
LQSQHCHCWPSNHHFREPLAGHLSRQMLARYSHIRMEAKRKALEGIVSKPAPAPKAPQATEEEKPAKPTVQPVQ